MQQKKQILDHKPTIETILNTTALALTSFGVVQLTTNTDGWSCFTKGFILILFGAGLEFFKYWGRKKQYW
jgi:hypothetical protein